MGERWGIQVARFCCWPWQWVLMPVHCKIIHSPYASNLSFVYTLSTVSRADLPAARPKIWISAPSDWDQRTVHDREAHMRCWRPVWNGEAPGRSPLELGLVNASERPCPWLLETLRKAG